MINKKIIILSLLIVILMSVQCVSAIDDADINIMGDNKDNGVLQAPSETQSYTDLKTVIDNAPDGAEITLNFNYQFNYQGSNDPRTGINITRNLVIDGNGATITGSDDSNNPCALFNISSGVTVTLKNLTITKNGGVQGWSQGDIHLYRVITSQSDINIVDCTFVDNDASRFYSQDIDLNGGVIYSTTNINIQNSIFMNNKVQNFGVVYTTGRVTVNNSKFDNNAAVKQQNQSIGGGAIYAGSIDIIENSTFTNNKGIYGGAICISNGDSVTSIKNSTFENNGGIYSLPSSSEYIGAFGGAIYTVGSIDLIENSTFKKNIATAG